ncbi:MAG: hypothetical protein ABI230_03735 [Aestuariivirga sp.]
MMTMNIRKLLFAGVILIATSSVAYGQCTAACGGKPTPPPPSTHNNIIQDEYIYSPIGGAKSKPQVQVLNACRKKYSRALNINAVWQHRFNRTGWWCAYKWKK